MAAETAVTSKPLPAIYGRSPYVALGILFLVNILNTIDRNLLVVLNEPIKLEFALSDAQVGLLSTAFAISYAAAGFPIGMAVDRVSRRGIIAGCLSLWSGMTALCGVATSHVHLLLARIGVGAGEAGSGPATLSLLSEYFPVERRATMTSVYYLSTAVGITAGMAVGGWIAQTLGWRATFLIAAAPAVVLVPLMFLLVPEPARSSGVKDMEQSSLGAFLGFLRVQTSLRWIIIGNIINVLVISGLGAWFVSYMLREHGTGLARVGLHAGLIHGALGIIGTLAGGMLADRLSRSDARRGPWLVAVSCLLTRLTFIGLMLSPSVALAMSFYVFYCLFSSIWFGPVYSLILTLVVPRMRGKSSAFLYVTTNLAGYGVGAPLVGYLSDRIGGGSAAGLGTALIIVASLSGAAATCLLMASRTLRADLARSAEHSEGRWARPD